MASVTSRVIRYPGSITTLYWRKFNRLFAPSQPKCAQLATHPYWYDPAPGADTMKPIEYPSEAYNASTFIHDPYKDFNYSYQNVSFYTANPAAKKLVLRGWYVPGERQRGEPAVGVVGVHGGGYDRRGLLKYVPIFHSLGYDVLLYDSSHHGISDGNNAGIGFGQREHLDCIGAVRWGKKAYHWKEVIVFGTSVGAVSAILAAAKEPQIDMVIAENPFYSSYSLFLHLLENLLRSKQVDEVSLSEASPFLANIRRFTKYLPKTTIMLMARMIQWYSGTFGRTEPIDVIERLSPRPILLIHSNLDQLIPSSHSRTLYEHAREPKRLWLTNVGGHAEIYNYCSSEYEAKLKEFIFTYLDPSMSDPQSVSVSGRDQQQEE